MSVIIVFGVMGGGATPVETDFTLIVLVAVCERGIAATSVAALTVAGASAGVLPVVLAGNAAKSHEATAL